MVTNPANWEADGRLSVQRLVPPDAPHGCARCPVNMCKGAIVDRYGGGRVVYAGDGANDYCAWVHLPPDAVLLPRRGFKLDQMVQAAQASGEAEGRARVRCWETYDELAALLREELVGV